MDAAPDRSTKTMDTATQMDTAILAAAIAADVAVSEIERRREGATTGERAKLYDALKAAQWARGSAQETFETALRALPLDAARSALDARLKGANAECERLRRERLAPKKTPARKAAR